MAGIGDILKTLGRGAATGLGAALTPPAMILAARQGRSPFSALPGYKEPLNDLQQAQLLRALQAGELAGTQNALLRQAITQAGGGGMLPAESESVGVPGFSPEGVMQASTPPAPGGDAQTLTPPQQGQPGMRLSGLNVGGMQFSVPGGKTTKVAAGTINPATGKPYASGEFLPSGEAVIVNPSPQGQANRNRVTLARSALTTFNTIYNRKYDPKTGKPSDTGVYPTEVLPSGQSYGGTVAAARAVLPREIFGIATRTRAAYGNPLAARIEAGEGTVVSFVKAFGDAANIAEKEQDRALRAFLPNTGDTRESGDIKRELTPQILQELIATLEANPDLPEDQQWGLVQEAAAKVNSAVESVGGTPSGAGAPTQPSAPSPITSVRDRFRALGTPPGKTLRRATGGPVGAGQSAVVGERGPELWTAGSGGASVTPLSQDETTNLIRQKPEPRRLMVAANTPDAARGAAYTGAPPQTTTTTLPGGGGGGFGQGQGLTPEDAARAQAGGVRIIMGPNGPVVVPAGQ